MIDFIEMLTIKYPPDEGAVNVEFFLTEPLMEFQKIKRYFRRLDSCSYFIFTNGDLLNDEVAEFCIENQI